ncbi:MAG: hypothetical protein ABEI77_08560 [Halorientalis sp.]
MTTAGCSKLGGSGGNSDAENDTTSTDGSGNGEDAGGHNETGDLGQSLTTKSGVELTYRKVAVTQTIRTDKYSRATHSAMAGKTFVLLKVQARTASDDAELPSRSEFKLTTDATQYIPRAINAPFKQPVTGEPYSPSSWDSSETSEVGWIVYVVPEETTNFRLAVPSAQTETGDVTWDVIADAGDEITFELTTTKPDSLTIGDSGTLAFTVENTGHKTGRFYRSLEISYPGVTDDQHQIQLDYTIDPGETKTFSVSVTPSGVGSLRVTGLNSELALQQIAPASLSFGETWTTPQGVELTVSDVTLSGSTTYRANGSTETAEAGTRLQFAFVHLTVTNPTTEEQAVPPWDSSISISAEGSTYDDVFNPESWSTEHWQQPVDQSWYGQDGNLESGGQASGVVPLKIPSDLSKQDLSVTTNYQIGWTGPTVEATWSASGD